MSSRAALEALLADVTPTLRATLERAYDLGYREAIAQTPDASPRDAATGRALTGIDRLASDARPRLPDPTPADARANTPAFLAWNQDSVHDDDEEDDEDDDSGEDASQPGNEGKRRRKSVGIRATSSVGALKTKIEKKFRLDRFEIEIIIARPGDPERRQLRADARLSKYLRAVEE